MSNHSSSAKEARKSVRRASVNKNRNSRIKTYIKKVLASVVSGNKSVALELFKVAQSEIMRGVTHKILKLNTASRKVSMLYGKVNGMN